MDENRVWHQAKQMLIGMAFALVLAKG